MIDDCQPLEDDDAAEHDRLAELFAVADEIIDAGFDVLPAAVWVKSDGTLGKAPLLVHGHLDAHRDRQLIRQQLVDPPHVPKDTPTGFEVVVGFVPGSGGCGLLDFDIKNGKAGAESYRKLTVEHGAFATSAWRSPSGGGNVLFRKPPGVAFGNTSPWPGVDVRADSGWVVAPGNSCAGGDWTWFPGTGFATASPLPPSMADQLKPPSQAGRKATNAETVAFIERSPTTSTLPVMQKFAAELEVFRAAKPNGRHAAMLHIVSWSFGMQYLDLRWAMREIKTEWLRLTAGEGREDEVDEFACWVVGREAAKRAAQPPPGVDPETGEVRPSVTLPDEFWTSRPVFEHVRQAAHSRGRSADAVLGGVLARVALFTPPTLRLPAIVAAPCGLDLYVALVGPSGGGKSSAYAIARELLPGTIRSDLVDGRPLGSGEGVAEAFYGTVSVPPVSGKGKPTIERKLVNSAVLIYVDEGETISRIGQRRGSTLLPELRAGWSGQTIGQGNAAVETTRIVPAGKYRLVLVVNWQPELAATVLGHAVGGFPQRLAWFSALDRTVPRPEDRPAWPGSLSWRPPPTITLGNLVTVAADVVAEIAERDWRRSAGIERCHPLDAHRDLSRLKVAALLGLLDDRLDVTADDWRLAGMILDTSDAVRALAVVAGRDAEQQENERRTASAARRAVVVDASVDQSRRDQALARMAKAIGRKLAREAPAVVSRRDLTLATTGADREFASVADAIAAAVEAGWAVEADGGWTAGLSRPA